MMTRWFNSLPYVQPFISEFVITVKTDNAGVSASNEILLPIQGTNMVIDWGDGSVSTHTQTATPNNTIGGANVKYTYASVGVYQIKISPSITRIFFNNGGDRLKLLEINNWGKALWASQGLVGGFYGCNNLSIVANDIPDLKLVTSLSETFRTQQGLSSISSLKFRNWKTENIVNLFRTFFITNIVNVFNPDVSNWDVSKITTLEGTFTNLSGFNRDLSGWNVSNVTNLANTFQYCRSFNSNLNNWNVSKVTNLSNTFFGAQIFNSPLNNWNVSNVTNISGLFADSGFNQDISNWNTSKVTSMATTFRRVNLITSINTWDVSKVTNMTEMFSLALIDFSLGDWEINQNVNLTSMLNLSSASQGSALQEAYSRTLIGWANNIFSRGGVVTGRSLGATNRRYNSINYVSGQQFNNAVDARNYLVNTLGWTITGDVQV
jgi:surface protein